MNRWKWAAAATLTILLCAGLLAGCSDKKETEEIKTLGKIYEVTLENATGKDITGLAMKDAAAEDYSGNKLMDGDVFGKEEKRKLIYDAAGTGADGVPEEVESNMQLTFEDGETMELTAIPFSDMDQCQLCLEDEVAFLTYVSKESEEEISTKDAELKQKKAAEKKAAEKAKKKAEAKAKKAEKKAAEKAKKEAAAQAQKKAQQAQAAKKKSAAKQTTSRKSGGGSKPKNADGCIGNDDKLLY